MVKLQVIIGTTRPGRVSPAVGKWVEGIVAQRDDVEVELVDIADYDLPIMDEPVPPSIAAEYTKEYTKKWSAKIAEADGYIFVTGEYDHSIPGSLKNAIDYLYKEWNNKAAGIVSYGSASGIRAAEHLRGILSELQIAHVRSQVFLSLATDFKNYSEFTPLEYQTGAVSTMVDQLVPWTEAMKGVREKS